MIKCVFPSLKGSFFTPCSNHVSGWMSFGPVEFVGHVVMTVSQVMNAAGMRLDTSRQNKDIQ